MRAVVLGLVLALSATNAADAGPVVVLDVASTNAAGDAAGTPDANYSLTGSPGGGTAQVTTPNTGWGAAPSGSGWIGVSPDANTANDPTGTYEFSVAFNIAPDVAVDSVEIVGEVLTDNFLVDILVNGVGTGISTTHPGFLTPEGFSITENLFQTGANTITFVVEQLPPTDGANPVGLAVGISSATAALVPEPTSLALWGCVGGLGWLGIRRRRRLDA